MADLINFVYRTEPNLEFLSSIGCITTQIGLNSRTATESLVEFLRSRSQKDKLLVSGDNMYQGKILYTLPSGKKIYIKLAPQVIMPGENITVTASGSELVSIENAVENVKELISVLGEWTPNPYTRKIQHQVTAGDIGIYR